MQGVHSGRGEGRPPGAGHVEVTEAALDGGVVVDVEELTGPLVPVLQVSLVGLKVVLLIPQTSHGPFPP